MQENILSSSQWQNESCPGNKLFLTFSFLATQIIQLFNLNTWINTNANRIEISQYGRNDWMALKRTGETSLTGRTSYKIVIPGPAFINFELNNLKSKNKKVIKSSINRNHNHNRWWKHETDNYLKTLGITLKSWNN